MTNKNGINSVDDIKTFLYELTALYKKEIFPEVDFSELLDDNNLPLFTMEQAEQYDEKMLDCFVFCNDHRIDISDVCAAVWREYKKSTTAQLALS